MATELAYGDGRVSLDLPGSWETLPPVEGAPLPDPAGAMIRALAGPVGSPPLDACVPSGGRVVISVPDLTRPFPTGDLLPPLLDALNGAGVPDSKIAVLVATGLHRSLGGSEISALLGPAAGRIGAENHDAMGELATLGATSRSTPVAVNGRLIEADLVLTLGSTAFHFHAGFGGGPKGVVPGLAGAETARTNHLLALSGPGDGWHPGCGPGRLDGNPVHEDLVEAVSLLPTRVFIVNFVFHPGGFPLAVAAGDVRAAHREVCRVHAGHFSEKVDAPYDAVVVSAGGAPRDGNLIQSHKALAHAEGGLKEGGVLVLLARCPEGWGHEDLPSWFGHEPETMRERSRETGRKYVQTAYSLQRKAARFRTAVVSDLPHGPLKEAGFTPLASPSEAGPFLEGELGRDFRGLVVPDSTCLLQRGW